MSQSEPSCKTCGGKLIKKETKRKASQLLQKYYYSAYYFCPTCEKIYHNDIFKVFNKNYDLFTENEIEASVDELRIWTDGACLGNGTHRAKAAWAFVSGEHEASGLITGKQTNNRAEAFAIYHALVWAESKDRKYIRIYTDSQITIHGLNKPAAKVVENRDIFEKIAEVVKKNKLTVVYEKVLGHAGDVNNTRADNLANTRAKSDSN